ncbi:hypothetical protein H0H87_004449 [Tephrocybe sp. NHM501043]|nr:hypothetical protein H0H87_004449 [Tephrocybe sp. NHM501043]
MSQIPGKKLTLKALSEKTNAHETYLSDYYISSINDPGLAVIGLFPGVTLSALSLHGYFTEIEESGTKAYANNSFSNVLRADSDAENGKSMKDAIGLSLLHAYSKRRIFDLSERQLLTLPLTPRNPSLDGHTILEMNGEENAEERQWYNFTPWLIKGVGEDYAWDSLKSPIVDIGGGIGSLPTMVLAVPKNKDLAFILFDLA